MADVAEDIAAAAAQAVASSVASSVVSPAVSPVVSPIVSSASAVATVGNPSASMSLRASVSHSAFYAPSLSSYVVILLCYIVGYDALVERHLNRYTQTQRHINITSLYSSASIHSYTNISCF